MSVYISTGGFKNLNFLETAKLFKKNGINNIELSGGAYTSDVKKKLHLVNKFANIQLHNYFPPPKKSFVLNLASLDEKIFRRSNKHIMDSIKLCSMLGKKYYSFHAGFLCDIKPNELGKKIKKKKIFPRNVCLAKFISRITNLSIKAKKLRVKLMIENNVLSSNNLKEFETNPFLMADPEECKYVLDNVPKNVGLLVDVAHVKISSKSLNFQAKRMFDLNSERIFGYHLSDNDGLKDSNKSFNSNSWFWKYLKNDKKYYSIEVYNGDVKKLRRLQKLTIQKLI